MTKTACILLLVCGCGSTQPGSVESPLTKCDPRMRAGTYWMEFETISGDCGDQASGLISMDSAGSGDDADHCVAVRGSVSTNGCRIDSQVRCTPAGAQTDITEYTVQQTANGSRLEGEMTMTGRGADGSSCNGSYRISMTRR